MNIVNVIGREKRERVTERERETEREEGGKEKEMDIGDDIG